MGVEREQAILFCLVGPAGAGKSSICETVCGNDSSLVRSISSTTRSPRKGEVDGTHYFFISRAEFEEKVKKDLFMEHAVFNENLYGTDTKNITRAEDASSDLILDIDVQGVIQLKRAMGARVVSIFVHPPSFAELEKRLRNRKTEDEETILRRLSAAKAEVTTLSDPSLTDYLLVNDTFDESVSLVESIIASERMRFSRLAKPYIDLVIS